MKKILFMMCMALVASISFISCDKGKKDDTKSNNVEVVSYTDGLVGVGAYDVERTLQLDAEYVAMHYGDASLYEVILTLNEPADSIEEAYVVHMKTIFQAGDKCIMADHPTFAVGKEPSIKYEVHDGWWMECMPIELPVKLNVSDMVIALNESNIVKPHSRTVVLRKPLVPPFKGTYYIVGTMKTGFVSVDVDTKEVKTFK